jgi:hypothetical protein
MSDDPNDVIAPKHWRLITTAPIPACATPLCDMNASAVLMSTGTQHLNRNYPLCVEHMRVNGVTIRRGRIIRITDAG